MAAAVPNFGWAGPKAANAAWGLLADQFVSFAMPAAAFPTKRVVAWDFEQKLLGRLLDNQPQQIGDCVSWGVKHAVDRLAVFEILSGDAETFRPSFAPYFYFTSRVMVGGAGNRPPFSGDGSLGVWGAKAAEQFGVLATDEPGVPSYSGKTAREWGDGRGDSRRWLAAGKNRLVRSAARLQTVEEIAVAVSNGHFCTIASNRGFAMRFKDDRGKSWFTGQDTWPHQMWIAGFDPSPEPCFYRGNNWGVEAHGPQLDGPPGGGWQTADSLRRELTNDVEVFAFSRFDGFPSVDVENLLI